MSKKIQIHIMPKTDILDPQGINIEKSLHNLGYDEVKGVRIGKIIELNLDSMIDFKRIDEMCNSLLVNGVIEDYRIFNR